MFRFHRFLPSISVSALLHVLPLCAQADVQYTTQTSMAQGGVLKPISTKITFAKLGLERTDTTTLIGSYHSQENAISVVATHQYITIDPNLKIYAVLTPTGGFTETLSADGMASKPGAPKGKGTMTLTLGTQFLGNTKMLGYNARHYKSSTTIDSTGCCGAGHTVIKKETWMADVKLPVIQAKNQKLDWKETYARVHSECDISFARKGDIAKYDQAQKGLALKIITFDRTGKPLLSSEITRLSLAPLSAATFKIPAGFTKVTRTEYDQKRQQAMVAAMTSGATDEGIPGAKKGIFPGTDIGADDNN